MVLKVVVVEHNGGVGLIYIDGDKNHEMTEGGGVGI